MLDLTNPDHARILRGTAAIVRDMRPEQLTDWRAKLTRDAAMSEDATLVCDCVEALSSPALAADLIRQLAERVGAKWYLTTTKLGVAFYRDKPHRREEEEFWFACHELPVLITRLLDIAPNAGAEAVLKALRGAP